MYYTYMYICTVVSAIVDVNGRCKRNISMRHTGNKPFHVYIPSQFGRTGSYRS